MRALVIILNKDNGEKLRECLETLAKQTARICSDFDVLILDGGSKDNSKDVAAEFEKKYSCIKFKVQDKLGGTGFARREGCFYALSKGYDVVIWGDSENAYAKNYVEKMLEKLKSCDAVAGVPIVRGGFFAHAFAWYHAIHLIFPKLYRRHIPGNNKGEWTSIYRRLMYPESKRAEDYGFSLLLIKKGIKLKQDVADAKVFISVPETLQEVFAWQKARAKGAAEAAKLVGFKPLDALAWAMILLIFAPLAVLAIFNPLPLIAYTTLLISSAVTLSAASFKYIEKPRKRYILAPLFGVLIHSFYSLISLLYYIRLR